MTTNEIKMGKSDGLPGAFRETDLRHLGDLGDWKREVDHAKAQKLLLGVGELSASRGVPS